MSTNIIRCSMKAVWISFGWTLRKCISSLYRLLHCWKSRGRLQVLSTLRKIQTRAQRRPKIQNTWSWWIKRKILRNGMKHYFCYRSWQSQKVLKMTAAARNIIRIFTHPRMILFRGIQPRSRRSTWISLRRLRVNTSTSSRTSCNRRGPRWCRKHSSRFRRTSTR